jgi:histidinol-phosphate aminotransferase
VSAVTSPRLRPALRELPSYSPGKSATQVNELAPYKMSSNENPYPPLPGVLEAIAAASSTSQRYPDARSSELVAVLADRLGVPAGHLAASTGSVAVLAHLMQITCDAGDEVVFAWRSFEAYPILARIAGAVPVQVPLRTDLHHDLDAMAAAVTDRTRIILVCTPNNPTGPVVRQPDLDAFLARVPPDVLVVVDEAYVEFVRDTAAVDGLATYRAHENVAVLRTFSKAYGLAGLRVGYAVAHEPVAAALRKVATPFGVSAVAQAAAVASLAAEPALLERVQAVVQERSRVVAGLRDQGYDIAQAEGNFVWLALGTRTQEFAEACAEVNLAVRPFGDEGVRVTIAEPAANTRLLSVTPKFAPEVVRQLP